MSTQNAERNAPPIHGDAEIPVGNTLNIIFNIIFTAELLGNQLQLSVNGKPMSQNDEICDAIDPGSTAAYVFVRVQSHSDKLEVRNAPQNPDIHWQPNTTSDGLHCLDAWFSIPSQNTFTITVKDVSHDPTVVISRSGDRKITIGTNPRAV